MIAPSPDMTVTWHSIRKGAFLIILCSLSLLFWQCEGEEEEIIDNGFTFKEKLSDYGFFTGPLSDLNPVDGIIPFDLVTPLFTDYAHKLRFIKIPEGMSAGYRSSGILDLPEGTILIKNFFYYDDERNMSAGKNILETRLLVKDEGEWKVATYIWNSQQTEASREILGKVIPVSWIDGDGENRSVNYEVPDNNDCKSCHKKMGQVTPIGPTAASLNRIYDYADGSKNQLEKLQEEGILNGLPALSSVPVMADWLNTVDFSLEERARAYLHINCAHCHTQQGPAGNTGLFLEYEQTDLFKLGFCKTPVSAAQGSGNLRYDIVPGNADSSIVVYRMNSVEVGVAMPELGKTVVHTEGVELIRDWINSLSGGCN